MSAKVYHLNCGSLLAWGLFPFSTIPIVATGKLFRRGLVILHCLLVDTGDGLLLVDTGYGTQDYTNSTPFVRFFNKVIGLKGDIGETALRQIEALGYRAGDVKHIFLTHMHLDHSSGLPDFPQAKIHVFETELDRALNATGLETKFCPEQYWAHGPDWEVHRLQGDSWYGLDCTPQVDINGVEAFFVPTPGHSAGHCMVVLHMPDGRWIIHAGDTYGYHGQIEPDEPFYPPYHRLFRPLLFATQVIRSMFMYDGELRRLRRELGDRLEIFCTHDPHEFERLSGQKIIGAASKTKQEIAGHE